MKGKTKFMSMLLSTLMISTCFSSLVVKASGAGADIGPTAVGQPTTVNGVTSQEYEIKVPYYDDNVTDHHYELGSKDTQTVLSTVPNSITRTIQGKTVTFKATNVEFNDDTNRDFPKKVSHSLNVNCGVMDYALYQYKKGGYSISAAELQNNFKEIQMSAVDSTITPGGGCNSNEMLVWSGIYSNDSLRNPIFACEPYQLFYPPINGSSSQAQLRREPYDVASRLTVGSTSMTQGLTYREQPITIDLPQGQSISSSQKYDFYAISSKDLSFTYTATNGSKSYTHTSYTTLSQPMTLSDLQYFYPDYSDSSYFFKNKLCSVQGSQFTDAGTITRTNINGSTQTVHRYTANYTFGYIEPSAVYTYTSLDHLYVPTVTYRGTLQTTTPTPTPTPTTGAYTLNISYVDEDTDQAITNGLYGCETSKEYDDRDLKAGNKGIKWAIYTPARAPSGYTLDTCKYHTGDNGYKIIFDFPNIPYGGLNGIGSGNTADLKVYCKSGGPVTPPTPTPDPTPVITTSTVIKRYYINYVEQPADREYLYDVDEGQHTYSCTKTYNGYTCINSTTTVNVTAGEVAYADFYFKKSSAPPTAYIYGPDTAHQGSQFTVTGSGYDPQGESLTYYWTTSDGQTITGTQGTLKMGDKPITVTLYVTDTEGLSSPVVSKTINPKNNPPTVTLNLPETIVLGDDLNVNAAASDSDGDTIKYTWNTPDGMTGTLKNNGGTVQFMNKNDVGKKKAFTVTVDDDFGGTTTATAATTVIAPKPTVSINQGGILKENRKVTLSETSNGGSKSFPIANSKTQWSFYDNNNNAMNVTNTADSGIVESLDDTTGTSSMNVLFTRPGTYKVQCEVMNTNGDTAVDTKTIIITPDLVPTADFNVPQVVLRDPNNGNLATTTITDNSSSQDKDIIDKRVWFYCFDSNNNGNDEDDVWYVFENGLWIQFGTYADVKALLNNESGLDAINSGNLTTVKLIPQNFNNDGQIQSHVGDYYYKEIVRESFGQDTIQNLVSIKDYKVNIK